MNADRRKRTIFRLRAAAAALALLIGWLGPALPLAASESNSRSFAAEEMNDLPVAAGTVGRVFVAWTEATDKGAQVMLSRGRKGSKAAVVTSGVAKNKAGWR